LHPFAWLRKAPEKQGFCGQHLSSAPADVRLYPRLSGRTSTAVFSGPAKNTTMTLTDKAVRNPRPRDKAYKLSDQRGLFVQVTPNGSRLWRFRYRFAGKQKTPCPGEISRRVSLADARRRTEDTRRMLYYGKAPSKQRKREKHEAKLKSANSLEAVERDYVGRQSNRWPPAMPATRCTRSTVIRTTCSPVSTRASTSRTTPCSTPCIAWVTTSE